MNRLLIDSFIKIVELLGNREIKLVHMKAQGHQVYCMLDIKQVFPFEFDLHIL